LISKGEKDMAGKARMALIGVGGMARYHIRQILKQSDTTEIVVMCEPLDDHYELAVKLFEDAGQPVPPNEKDLRKLLRGYALDSAFIVTPHVFHFEQTCDCLETGLDVLLEKPMVMNAHEAKRLIDTRDKTGKLLVVAFPGSLSPSIRSAVNLLRSGDLGRLISISATVWQDWGSNTVDTWRQDLAISGGGFLFDTGAHMLNTVVDLAGEEFVDVAAWQDNYHRPVEILSAVIGRLESGAVVTLHGCGEAPHPSCDSDVMVFCSKAILRTGIWGERLELKREGRKQLRKVKVPDSQGVWEQFLMVRQGNMANPCPPEVGLRMARLYDAIVASAAKNGQPVKCK
jgi:predicted dehydrogenase